MSELETQPPIVERGGLSNIRSCPVEELIAGRVASLGDGTEVRRLLPTLGRRMVGAWCFLDHYGPDDVVAAPGMQVPPHPHAGLQTVSWLFEGTVHHQDSLGSDVVFGPGQLGLMTAGRGIAHSERSPVPHPRRLHGNQLWVALPDSARNGEPGWEFHPQRPALDIDGAAVQVVLGEFGGARSSASTYSPIVGVDVRLPAGTAMELPLEPDFEYAAISVGGSAAVAGVPLPIGSLLYLGAGRDRLAVNAAVDAPGEAHLMLLGGEPFAESIVMWWNFVGRDHDEIADFRQRWQEHERFPDVPGWNGSRTEAPPLPAVRLKPRGRAR